MVFPWMPPAPIRKPPEVGLPFDPPPAEILPVDPEPWVELPIPPDEEKRPPPPLPPVVVIEPVEKPPVILPPPPDITPPTIVPPQFEDPIPEPYPVPPVGIQPPTRPPPTIVIAGAVAGVGTFMVYLGKRLLLSMAASTGSQLGAHAGAMLIGPLGKTMSRGVRLRYHTGVSPGAMGQASSGMGQSTSVGYEQAWRMVPQEFSYWEK